MQVVMNKCFLLNPEKNWRRSVLSFLGKTQKPLNFNALQFQKNDITEPNSCFQVIVDTKTERSLPVSWLLLISFCVYSVVELISHFNCDENKL